MNRGITSLLTMSALAAGTAAAAPPEGAPQAWNATFSIEQGTTMPADAAQDRLAHALQGPALWSRDAAAGLLFDDLSGVGARYSIVRLAAGLARSLPRDFLLRATVHSQYSSPSVYGGQYSAQSGAGEGGGDGTLLSGRAGARGGRNDFGLAGNVELYTPDLCGALAWRPCRALAFYDKAYIKRNRELAGGLRGGAIGSAGFGLRLQVRDNANLQFDYARVLRSGLTERADRSRLHVRLALAF